MNLEEIHNSFKKSNAKNAKIASENINYFEGIITGIVIAVLASLLSSIFFELVNYLGFVLKWIIYWLIIYAFIFMIVYLYILFKPEYLRLKSCLDSHKNSLKVEKDLNFRQIKN